MSTATNMVFSGLEADKQAKDDNYLPCFYAPPIDSYNKNLVRDEDFVQLPTRRKDKSGNIIKETFIRRRGECFYDSGNGFWQYRTVEKQEVEKRVEVEFDVATGKAVTENTPESADIDVRFENKIVTEKIVGEWYKVHHDNIEFI